MGESLWCSVQIFFIVIDVDTFILYLGGATLFLQQRRLCNTSASQRPLHQMCLIFLWPQFLAKTLITIPCVALTSFPGQDSCCLSAHISPIPSNQNAIRPLQAVWNANSTLPWQRGWVNINRMPDSSSALTPWLWTKGADASKGLLRWHFLSYVLNVAAAPPDLTHSVALEALEFVSLFSHPMRTWDIALT